MQKTPNLISIKQASHWASTYTGKSVTPANIAYLIQYGRIAKNGDKRRVLVDQGDLEAYYQSHAARPHNWQQQLGDDLNWHLSFAEYKEAETTKHVHRLHSYKGKFIPQLVEYFLDQHTDAFKQQCFFRPGDIVLDPFCGSGTMLVQANELNLHALGVDVSAFNAFLSNAKIAHYDVTDVRHRAAMITHALHAFQADKNHLVFEQHLLAELKRFNAEYFPAPQFRYKIRHGVLDEQAYASQQAAKFGRVYDKLIEQYQIKLQQPTQHSFLDKWFLPSVRAEIDFVFHRIQAITKPSTKKLLALVLSRTLRSCRATPHADLGTLKACVTTPYYCKKHGKICKPLFSIASWWQRYVADSMTRIGQFARLRSDSMQYCLSGDSRSIDIMAALPPQHAELAALLKRNKIAGIFSSPPYVGLIDYHEQHAYAYDLFGFVRNDQAEIGPLCKGQGSVAQKAYVADIASVLQNCKQYLKPDYDVLLVANDKNQLYPTIAARAGMRIVSQYKRPVLNRVEKERSAYSEVIFHLKEK